MPALVSHAKPENQSPGQPGARTKPLQHTTQHQAGETPLRAPNISGRHQLTAAVGTRRDQRPLDRGPPLRDVARVPTQTTPQQGGQPLAGPTYGAIINPPVGGSSPTGLLSHHTRPLLTEARDPREIPKDTTRKPPQRSCPHPRRSSLREPGPAKRSEPNGGSLGALLKYTAMRVPD
ncbi:hypothetical protein CRENBAI_011259 [Crenichthys baileyi]|uniref:Uncharacterized protein n=1 Tax=Crenichthys baileyi TaxID=28760 RepID=A0AAV9QU26_9TELE